MDTLYYWYHFFFSNLVKILLVLIIFHKMITDNNDALLKFWCHLVVYKLEAWPFWCRLLWGLEQPAPERPGFYLLNQWNQNLSKASLSVIILWKIMSTRCILTNFRIFFWYLLYTYQKNIKTQNNVPPSRAFLLYKTTVLNMKKMSVCIFFTVCV